jgi:hypothetical protein
MFGVRCLVAPTDGDADWRSSTADVAMDEGT